MKIFFLALIAVFGSHLVFTCSSAFAIDQVTLNSGEVVQGKILADVPNRHVDIELTNGTRKRFQKNEVSSIERDVPSQLDQDMIGVDSRMYFGVVGGLSILGSSATSSNANSQFGYGLRFGANMTQLGHFSKFAAGLYLDHYSATSTVLGFTDTLSVTNIFAQLNFRKVANTGFYFGPEVGISLLSDAITATVFAAGGNLGYEYFVSNGFSFGPEVHLDHHGSSDFSGSATEIKIFLAATLHFE